MVPLGSLATVRLIGGPLVLTRYNMYPAASIQGNAAAGVSTGQAIATMEETARREFPRSMSFEWTEIAYIEKMAANTGMVVFGLSVVFVFLVLAALYESWSLPLAVILVVPMCVLSSLAGVWIAKMDINIFTQIGFVVLIGLASKNAILIVEFAKARREEGTDRRTATLHACELRLRPIMMTSFAFILGVVPLVVAHGAGAEMRRTLGTAVFSGMLGVTLFGILLTPVFFFVIDRIAGMQVFSSGHLHVAGTMALDVLNLGFIRRPIRARLARAAAKPLPKAAAPLSHEAQPSAVTNAAEHRPAHVATNGAAHDEALLKVHPPGD
jgi:multidrug efflux pump